MTNSNLKLPDDKFSGVISYIEGRSESAISPDEFRKVLENIKQGKSITVIVGDQDQLPYVKNPSHYDVHYNEPYQLYYWEHRHTDEALTDSEAHIDVGDDHIFPRSCGPVLANGPRTGQDSWSPPSEFVQVMKASKKPVVKFRLDITADGMPHPNEQFGPVDRESDHGESEHGENDHGESVSPFALDWRSSSVYLWSLIARDSAKKLSEESTDCSVDFEVLGDRIGAASLKFSSPYRNDQWPDQFLQAVAKGSASKPKLDHILDLVFRDLVSDPPPRGFMLLLDQLQSIIDPDHMTFFHKYDMLSQLLKQATTRKTTFSSPRAVIRGGLSGLTQGGSDTLEQPLGRFLASIDCSNGGDNSPRDSQHDDQNGSQNDRSVAQALDRTTVCVDSSVAPSIKEFLMPEETLILDVSELIKERVGASRHVQRLQRAVGGRRGALLDHLLRDRELGSVAADPHPEQQDDLTGRIEEDTCDAPAFMDPLLGFNSEGLSRQSLSTTDLLSAPVAQFCSLHERNGDLDRNTDYLHFVPIPTFVPKGTAFVKLHDDLDILALNRLHGRCLGQKLSTYLFNELRNKEHIGYVVDASFWPGDLKHNGVMIRIKSPVLNAEELRTRVLSALAEFDESCGSTDLRQSLSEIVQEMEEREFEHHWALQQLGLNSDRIPFLVSSMEKTAKTNDRGAFSRHFKQALTQKPYIALYM